jgi:peptidyl-prolyl cis-trans isomerase SurA
MHKILTFLFMTLPFTLLATDIKIIADVNGEAISNLDVEKRIELMTSLFGDQDIDKEKTWPKSQMLSQLIDEMIIISESQRLNIKLSNEELDNVVVLFFTQNFKLNMDEIDQYIKKHNIDLNVFRKQIKCQLLWNKIIETRVAPFINVNDKEVDDVKRQTERPDYLVTFQEFVIPNQKDTDTHSMAEDLIKRLRDDSDFIPKSPIKAHQTTVNLNQLKGKFKNILERLEIGDIADLRSSSEGYHIMKIIDKIQLSREFLESTLQLKQTMIKNSESVLNNLKEQKINCSNFDDLASSLKLTQIKELEIKVKDLNSDLQMLLNRIDVNEIVELREENALRLIMLCDIKSNSVNMEAIKQLIYQQKIMVQSSLLLDNMRKNSAVSYL